MISWGIAFFEYWLAVPANRWGSAVYSAALGRQSCPYAAGWFLASPPAKVA
jgi:hypothetical protein